MRTRVLRAGITGLAIAAATVVAAPSEAFHEASLDASMSTLAFCSTFADRQDGESAPGATSFADEIASTCTQNAAVSTANARQSTTLERASTHLTVRTRGTLSSETKKGAATVPFVVNGGGNQFVGVQIPPDDGPVRFRLAGTISVKRTEKGDAGATACGGVTLDRDGGAVFRSVCAGKARTISVDEVGESSTTQQLNVRARAETGISNHTEGAHRATAQVSWDLTLTVVPGDQQVDCGEPIIESVTLSEDLDCTGDGLLVAFPNITIDLGGHRIRGDGTVFDAGISNRDGHDGVRVRNGTIEGFGNGLALFGDLNKVSELLVINNSVNGVLVASADNTIRNVTSRGNRIDGFAVAGDGNHLIDNFAEDNGFDGIALGVGGSASDNLLRGNRSQSNSQHGISVNDPGSKENVLLENKLDLNGSQGVSITGSDENRIEDNRIDRSANPGVAITDSDLNRLIGNSLTGNGDGIFMLRSDGNTVRDNRLTRNTLVGISVKTGSDLNILKDNLVKESQTGFSLLGAADNILKGNTAKLSFVDGSAAGPGFEIFDATHNRFEGNLARENEGPGFLVEGTSAAANTFVGNTARGNLDNGFEVAEGAESNELVNNLSSENAALGYGIGASSTTGRRNGGSGNAVGLCADLTAGQVVCAQITGP